MAQLFELQGVAEAECRRAADLAEEAYRKSWGDPKDFTEKDMDLQHEKCLRVARQTYDAHAMGKMYSSSNSLPSVNSYATFLFYMCRYLYCSSTLQCIVASVRSWFQLCFHH